MMTAEQLKNSILALAFSGRLVEASSIEGTQLDELQKLEAKNTKKITQIVKDRDGLYYSVSGKKKICVQDELLFDIPSSWKWTSLKNVASVKYGYPFNSAMFNDTGMGMPLIRIRDVLPGYTNTYTTERCDEAYIINDGEMVIGMDGNFNVNFWKGGKAYLNQRVCVITANEDVLDQCFLAYYLPIEFERISGKVSYVTVKHLSDKHLNSLFVPLPPLSEQKRIVAKIEELMPFVDQYAVATTKLNNLNASFPDMMKKSILQEAVQGKLVPHDPSDESASELLKKIAEEKQRLIKEGKIKKQKALPEITEDEIPFDIPDSWEWVRLDELASFENGDRGKNYPNKSEYVDKGVAWINTGHIEPTGYLTQINMNFITREKYDSLRSGKIEPHDLVFCLRGATYGKVALVKPYTEGAIASSLMIIRPIISSLADYLYLYLRSPLAFNELQKYANGSAQPNLGAKDVRKYLVPIPPLEEQRRIVGRIEELLPYIEELA